MNRATARDSPVGNGRRFHASRPLRLILDRTSCIGSGGSLRSPRGVSLRAGRLTPSSQDRRFGNSPRLLQPYHRAEFRPETDYHATSHSTSLAQGGEISRNERKMRILIVEDEPEMALLMSRRLGRAGFVSDKAECIGDAIEALRANAYSLVLLDRRLPDGDAAECIPAIRELRPSLPIMIISALDAYRDRVEGLDAGADDYLTKPFNGPEFLARVRARLRQSSGGAILPPIVVGRLSYDQNARQIMIDALAFRIHRREFTLLEALMRRANRVASREALTSSVYGLDKAVSPGALDTLVSRLRKRLEDAAAGAEIHLVRGRGYLLTETTC